MKYSRWLSIGAALALCLALAAPMNADAASQSSSPSQKPEIRHGSPHSLRWKKQEKCLFSA